LAELTSQRGEVDRPWTQLAKGMKKEQDAVGAKKVRVTDLGGERHRRQEEKTKQRRREKEREQKLEEGVGRLRRTKIGDPTVKMATHFNSN